jgi:hypothetical protein
MLDGSGDACNSLSKASKAWEERRNISRGGIQMVSRSILLFPALMHHDTLLGSNILIP